MLNFFNRTKASSLKVPTDQQQFERVLKISQNLLTSLYEFDRQRVWKSLTEQIRELYDCEQVSLFLVDDDDPNYLILKASSPPPATTETVRLRIISEPGRGITGHVAKEGKTIILNSEDIRSNPYIRQGVPTHLPSGVCYSALISPLKNRKHHLVGVFRVNNKSTSAFPERTSFTDSDKTVIELLGVEIVALLENAYAFDALRAVIGDVQKAGSTNTAVQCILTCAIRLLHASHAKLGLWSQAKGSLVFAGAKTLFGGISVNKGEAIPENNVMARIWKSTVESQGLASSGTVGDDEVCLNSKLQENSDLDYCDPDTQCSISVVLRVYQQPVGVLHLESVNSNGFDGMDRQILRALAQNVSLAIQSNSMPWPISDEETLESDQEALSLGEAGGLFHSIVFHTPLVMWRKDLDGRLTWVNHRFCALMRKSRTELLGKTDFELFRDKELAERYRNGDLKAQRDGKFEDSEEPFMLPHGERAVIHVFKKPFYDHFGNVAGTQGLFLDVSGDKYRQLFREAPIGFYELDAEGRVSHVNKAAREMLAYSEEDMTLRRFWELSEDPAVTEQVVTKHLKGEEPEGQWKQPINLLKKDHTTVPVSVASRRVTDAEGHETGLLCALREISAGAEIEGALRDPDSRYLAKIRELSMPVFRLDSDLKITYVNQAFLEEGGFRRKDVIGKTGLEIYLETDPILARKYHADNLTVLSTGTVIDQIEFHPQRDGQKIIVRVLKFPIRDSNNNVCGVQGVFWKYEDQNSAKKALTDALEEAKEEYRQIVQDAGEGIFQSTVEGKFIAANPSMVRLLGYKTEEELLSIEDAGVTRFAIDSHKRAYFERISAAERKSPQVIDYQISKGNGETIWVSETVQKVADHQNRERLVGFVMDISERHRAVEVRENMLRMLAHQLRSPAWQCYERADHLVHHMDPRGHLLSGENPSQEVRWAATIRGLARKTRGVAWSIDMMSALAHCGQIELVEKSLTPIPPRRLIRMAREAARDVQLIRRISAALKERMGIKVTVPLFEVDVDDRMESSLRIVGNIDLIEQSLGCVIENAFK